MVRVFFAWYDLWVGAYYDRAAGALYVCPLPTLVVRVQIKGGGTTPPPRRTRAQVLAARRSAVTGGCCNRFADHQACDCLERALPDEEVAADAT